MARGLHQGDQRVAERGDYRFGSMSIRTGGQVWQAQRQARQEGDGLHEQFAEDPGAVTAKMHRQAGRVLETYWWDARHVLREDRQGRGQVPSRTV